MKRALFSTTSALALFLAGGGRTIAAPLAAVSDSLLFGTEDQTDVVRESLSLVGSAAPLIGGATSLRVTAFSDRPTIGDPSSQTPSATFTYRPAVPVRGDAGPVGSIAANSRRNPGNVSNLKGTIGVAGSGIYSVPASAILIDEVPPRAYNSHFRPTLTVGAALEPLALLEAVPPQPARDMPAQSVFIGVRRPVGNAEDERAAREASIISATGSATPTVILSPPPGRPRPAKPISGKTTGLGYQLDTGSATTIGFSTADVRPTSLALGAAASTTLGYTYVPFSRAPNRGTLAAVGASPAGATLSATMTAPDGGPARRDWRFGAQAGAAGRPADPNVPPSAASTASAAIATSAVALSASIDTFEIARAEPGAAGSGMERLTIPILLKGSLAEPGSTGRSLTSGEAIEMDDETAFTSYGLVAAAVMVPLGLAFVGFRMIRRAALRRLE